MNSLGKNRFLKTMSDMKLYIIVFMFMGFCIAYLYSFYYKVPMYKSSAVMVLVKDTSKQTADNGKLLTQSDINLNKNLISTYINLAKSNKILEKVISNLNLDTTSEELSKLVSLSSVNNTEVIKLSVVHKVNKKAQEIANELVTVLSQEIKKLYNIENVCIMDYAELSDFPYNMNHIKDLIIGIIMGFISYFGVIILFYIFDQSINSEKDIEDFAQINVIGSIPKYNKMEKNDLVVGIDTTSPISEAIKICRTNIMFSNARRESNSILITSASPNEGKSFISSNLALSFAKLGKKVVLIDTDMRNGRIEKIFEIKKENGLSDILSNIVFNKEKVNINEYIRETKYKNLHIITSGNAIQNPSELLSSKYTYDLIETLKSKYDMVICDGTPCTLVSDSIILSKIMDYSVLVTSHKQTNIDTIKKVNKAIRVSGGKIDSAILNKLELTAKDYNSQYYSKKLNRLTNIEQEKIEHDVSLDEPLYVIKHKNNEKKEEIQSENIKESTQGFDLNALSEKLNYLSEVNDKLSKKIKLKVELLNQYSELSKEDIKNIYIKIDGLNSEFEEKIEDIKITNNEFQQKMNDIIELILAENTQLKEKLDNAAMFEKNNLQQMENMQNLLSLLKDFYENKFIQQEEYLMNLELEIKNLHDKTNMNKEIITNYVEEIREPARIFNIQDYIQNEVAAEEVAEEEIAEEEVAEEIAEEEVAEEIAEEEVAEEIAEEEIAEEEVAEEEVAEEEIAEEEIAEEEIAEEEIAEEEVAEEEVAEEEVVEEEVAEEEIAAVAEEEQVNEYVIKELIDEVLKEVEENDNIEKEEVISINNKDESDDTKNKEVAVATIKIKEEKVIKKGIFSFMQRKKYVQELEEENIETQEPISQILSIG